jgi:predicted protein tyrosine phosphatase
MITEVKWLGIREARALKPSINTAIISILDQSEEHERPSRLREFKDCLIMDFVDAYENDGDSHWPDQLSKAEHKDACTCDTDRAPELSDAQRIVDFVRKHHCSVDPTCLAVHCHGGVSRSAAVAHWVAVSYGVPMPQLGDGVHSLDRANPRVIRLLDKAAGRS